MGGCGVNWSQRPTGQEPGHRLLCAKTGGWWDWYKDIKPFKGILGPPTICFMAAISIMALQTLSMMLCLAADTKTMGPVDPGLEPLQEP